MFEPDANKRRRLGKVMRDLLLGRSSSTVAFQICPRSAVLLSTGLNVMKLQGLQQGLLLTDQLMLWILLILLLLLMHVREASRSGSVVH